MHSLRSRLADPASRPSATMATRVDEADTHRRASLEYYLGPQSGEAARRVEQLKLQTLAASSQAPRRSASGLFRKAYTTDVLFLLDATSSMSCSIIAAKRQIKNIVAEINRSFFNAAEVFVSVVAYRDHKDPVGLMFLDFTSDVNKVYSFIDSIAAIGGDDAAEDVLGGLNKALSMSWRNETRCIMHIADAPGHGPAMHDFPGDEYNDNYFEAGSEPHNLTHGPLLDKMIEMRINYIFFNLQSSTDKMVFTFMEAYVAAGATLDPKLLRSNRFYKTAELLASRKREEAANQRHNDATGAAHGIACPAMDSAISNTPTLFQNETGDGPGAAAGLHFEEVMMGTTFANLSHLVVSGVVSSASRTAVRMSSSRASSSRSSDPRSAGRSRSSRSKTDSGKPALGMLTEDDEDGNGKLQAIGEDCEEINVDRGIGQFDREEPQWHDENWFDETLRMEAFSTDLAAAMAPGLHERNRKQLWPRGRKEKGRAAGKEPMDAVMSAFPSVLDAMMASDDNISISTTELTIRRRSKPFALGSLRVAAYARTQESTNPLVAKSLRRPAGRTLAHLTEEMRLQALCKAFALEFNSMMDQDFMCIDFTVITILKPLDGPTTTSDDDDDLETDKASKANRSNKTHHSGPDPLASVSAAQCVSLEPLLVGEYVKYNTNCGGLIDPHRVAKNVALGQSNMAAQAFSHFTFERSRGNFLIVDLQGVGNVLTDPAVHTRHHNRFVLTDTNHNEDGFRLFFATHRCNSICTELKLQSRGHMLIDNDFAFRTDWPVNGKQRGPLRTLVRSLNCFSPTQSSFKPAHCGSNVVTARVCCSNKLCGKIATTRNTKNTSPGFFWCEACWPQLRASTVTMQCTASDTPHDYDVSLFFYESQGRSLPQACPEHLNLLGSGDGSALN